jgi:Trk K+ transport system NAD-binding subunit
VICGFGAVGETVAKFLTEKTVVDSTLGNNGTSARASAAPHRYVAFDLDPKQVIYT